MENRPFRELFPNLYHIAYNRQDTVANVLNGDPINLSFRRTLVGQKLVEFQNLVAMITQINLLDERDVVV